MNKDYFEELAARFIADIAQTVPDQLVSLVISSPLSTRSPDICMLWHPGYRKRHKYKLVIKLLFSVFKGCLKTFIKVTRSFGYSLYGKINDTILIVSPLCGSEVENGKYKTNYVSTEKDDAVFVFGPMEGNRSNVEKVQKISFLKEILIIYELIKSGTCAFSNLNGILFDKILLILQWLSWIVNSQWQHEYYLEKALSEVIQQYNIKKIGCIHEMHAYARIVWRVAYKYGARTYTVQHATISHGKRWYFCSPQEKTNGLVLPDVMYVYNKKVINILSSCYQRTHFILGCSCRYARWRNIESKEAKKSYYLFVGALACFDNRIMITSLRRLLIASKEFIPIRLRLHPFAELSHRDKHWIHSNVKKGIIEISKDISLEDDINNAIAVVGMSTTVLEEALLLDRQVIQLCHPDYLQYIDLEGIQGVSRVDYRELSTERLVNITANTKVNSKSMKERFGLNQQLVTYRQLFKEK